MKSERSELARTLAVASWPVANYGLAYLPCLTLYTAESIGYGFRFVYFAVEVGL